MAMFRLYKRPLALRKFTSRANEFVVFASPEDVTAKKRRKKMSDKDKLVNKSPANKNQYNSIDFSFVTH